MNALSHGVRLGLRDRLRQAGADPGVAAIVVACGGRTFIAGAADIRPGDPAPQPG